MEGGTLENRNIYLIKHRWIVLKHGKSHDHLLTKMWQYLKILVTLMKNNYHIVCNKHPTCVHMFWTEVIYYRWKSVSLVERYFKFCHENWKIVSGDSEFHSGALWGKIETFGEKESFDDEKVNFNS